MCLQFHEQYFRQGENDEANLALACRSCNLRKGTRISGIMPGSNTEVSFFHPRQDKWSEHFQVDIQSGKIIGITSSGKSLSNIWR